MINPTHIVMVVCWSDSTARLEPAVDWEEFYESAFDYDENWSAWLVPRDEVDRMLTDAKLEVVPNLAAQVAASVWGRDNQEEP